MSLLSGVENLNVLFIMFISEWKKIRQCSNYMDFMGGAYENPLPDWPENIPIHIRVTVMSAQKLSCVVTIQKRFLTRVFGSHIGTNRCGNTVWWPRRNIRILSPVDSEYWQIEILKSVTTTTKKPVFRYNHPYTSS